MVDDIKTVQMGDIDPLVAPLKSTSLWIRTDFGVDDYAHDHVSTLSGAGNPKAVARIQYPRLPDPWTLRSPVTTVQLVKRNRRIHVLVDGFSEDLDVRVDQNDPRRHLIDLRRHSGLHHDAESGYTVLSPLAVTMMVEDGQRPPTESKVSILSTTVSRGMSIDSTGTFSGSEILQPFRVDEPVAPVVYAPYPVVHASPPTIAFLDLSAVYKRELRKVDGALLTTIPLIFNLFVTAYFTSKPGPDAPPPPEPGYFAQFAKQVSDWWNLWRDQPPAQPGEPPPPTLEPIANSKYFQAALTGTAVSGAGLLATFLMLTGYGALGTGLLTAVTSKMSGKTDGSALLSGVWSGINAYLNTPVAPTPKSIRLTIPEFVRVLNVLSEVSQMTKEQAEAVKNSRSFRHELVVWRWFMEDEEGGILNKIKDKGFFSSNPIDLSKFNVPSPVDVGASHKVRVSVWDDEDDDGSGTPRMFDFTTNRDDASELGALVSNVQQDLEDLRTACLRFAESIDKAVNIDTDRSRWWDRWFFDPTVAFVCRQFPTQKEAVKKNTSLTRNNILKLVRSNIYSKLLRHFVVNASEGMRLRIRLLNSSTAFDADDDAALVLQATPFFWRRVLPQRLTPTYLFSSRSGADMDADLLGTVDADTETGSVRMISGLKDAVAQHTRAMRTSRGALVSLRNAWEVNQRVFLTQIVEEPTPLLVLNPYAGKVDVGGLTTLGSVPDDLRRREMTVRLTEVDQIRLDLISRPKKMSPMARIGFRESEHGVIAARTLAIFWADCLIASRSGEESYKQVDLMGGSLSRAGKRVAAAAEFILKTAPVTIPSIGYLPIDDPAMRATHVGRDVRVVLGQVLQKPTTPVASSIVNVALRPGDVVTEMRGVAEAMRGVATMVASHVAKQLQKQTPNDGYDVSGTVAALPFEPLQSLFMDPRHAIHAFRRVTSCMELTTVGITVSNLVASATAASYGSAQLLTGDDNITVEGNEQVLDYPRNDQGVNTTRAIRIRMAELRLDVPSSVNVHDNRNNSVDDLIDTFRVSAGVNNNDQTFFVPLGFGAVPSLPTMPIPAIMFSSVPVFTRDILERLEELSEALVVLKRGQSIVSATAAHEDAQVVLPVFETIGMIRELGEPSPNASLNPPCVLNTHGDRPTVVNFFGSTHAHEGVVEEDGKERHHDSRTAANSFISNTEEATRVRAAVPSLVWNTDRIAQALCIVASSGSGEFILDMDTVSHVPRFPPQHPRDTRNYTRMLELMGLEHLRIFKIYLEHMMQYAAFEFEEAKNDELVALGITSTPADVDDVKLDLAAESIVDQGPGDKALAPPVVATGALFDNNRNLDGDGVVSAILDNDTVFTDYDGRDWAKDIDAHVEVVMERILDHRWPDVPGPGEKSFLFRFATMEEKRQWMDDFERDPEFGIDAKAALKRMQVDIVNLIKRERDISITNTESRLKNEQEYNDTHARLCETSIRSMAVATVLGGALSNASLFDRSPKLVAVSFDAGNDMVDVLDGVVEQLKKAFGGSVKALRLAEAVLISAACAELL